jgi:hypothetical protein
MSGDFVLKNDQLRTSIRLFIKTVNLSAFGPSSCQSSTCGNVSSYKIPTPIV